MCYSKWGSEEEEEGKKKGNKCFWLPSTSSFSFLCSFNCNSEELMASNFICILLFFSFPFPLLHLQFVATRELKAWLIQVILFLFISSVCDFGKWLEDYWTENGIYWRLLLFLLEGKTFTLRFLEFFQQEKKKFKGNGRIYSYEDVDKRF